MLIKMLIIIIIKINNIIIKMLIAKTLRFM